MNLNKSILIKAMSIILLILVGVMIYSNNYECGWHFDDLGYIVNNPTIRSLTNFKEIWGNLTAPGRTVVLYSFALNYHFGKTDLFGYHLVNNIIHIITSILVYWMALLIFKTPRVNHLFGQKDKYILSLFIALFFLSHPMQTQAVTYICQRFASLATLFYAGSVCFYLKGRQSSSRLSILSFLTAALFAVLGMFSKQITITLPVSILLIEWLFYSDNNNLKDKLKNINWKLIAPIILFLLVVPALYSFKVGDILSISHKSSGNYRGELVNVYTYPLTQLRVIPTYIRLMFVPLGQNLLYDFQTSKSLFEIKTLAGLFFILGALFLAFKVRKTKVLIAFGVFWFFLTLSVESSIIPIRHVIFEHRVYLPSIGFSFFIVGALYYLLKGYKRVVTTMIIMTLALSVLTYQRNKVWLNEFTLWTDVKNKSPHKMRPFLNMGIAYSEIGEYDKAIFEFNKALEKNPRSMLVRNNKGIVYTKQHKFDYAINEYNEALKLDQDWPVILNNRGDAYRHKKEYQKALNDYNRALELDPDLYRTLSNRGVVYSHLNQNDLAMKDFNKAIKVDPDFIEAYQNRGNLHGMLKEYEKAISDFTKVIKANPTIAEVYNNRGNAYRRLKKYEQALADYNQALKLNPEFVEGYNNRGIIYRNWKKYDLAVKDYNKAIELNPDYVKAYNNRGNLYKLNKKYNLALKDFNTALGIDPNNKIIYFNRAQTLIQKKDYLNALNDAKRAKQLGYKGAEPLIKNLTLFINAQ